MRRCARISRAARSAGGEPNTLRISFDSRHDRVEPQLDARRIERPRKMRNERSVTADRS
jgi:hypothetical protein